MALTSSAVLQLSGLLTGTHDFAAPAQSLSQGWHWNLASGTAAGQADRMWSDQRTIAASGSEDLDLAGSLTDPFGATITFARIKMLVIQADAGNTNSVVVGNVTNAWATLLGATSTVTLRPGGLFAAVAGAADATGWAVTPSTGDLLHVANSGAGSGVTYNVYVIGASA